MTLAAINRSAMNFESWIYSKVCSENNAKEFDFEEDELPIFEVKSPKAMMVVTTRRIIERKNKEVYCVNFEEVDDVIYGDFKNQINKPELSKFRIVDIYGNQHDFQMETGKASIGLITCLNTVLKLVI